MNEYLIGFTAVGALFGLTFGCLFYMLGGRSRKWLRRWIASLVIAATVNVASVIMGIWSWWLLGIYPLLIISFSFGYGADGFWTKFARRLIYCFANITSGLIFCFRYGGNMWWIFIPHIGVAMWSVWFGIKNPDHAPAEETFICALLNLMLVAYPFAVL